LLVITDRHQARAPLDQVLAAAFVAGCRWASIREKDLPPAEQIALARRLLPIARQHGVSLTLHGDAALAKTAGLDGVHLPAGGNASAARRLLGQNALVGISIHTAEEAAKLELSVVDYAIAGPAYASASKPGYGPVLGLAGMAAIATITGVPLIAIGGISAGVIGEMRTSGAAGVAVMGSLMQAADPEEETRILIAVLKSADHPRPR
jgi:thiamine-phosphate pyrophosphorylase